MYVFISKTMNGDDFGDLLRIITYSDSIGKGMDSINFRWGSNIIVIEGKNLPNNIENFTEYFTSKDDKFKRDDETEKKLVKQLFDKINDIINKVNMKLTNEPNHLFIHWGGAGREIYSTRLRNAANKIGGFAFEIIEFSSTNDIKPEKFGGKSVYEVLTTKDSSVGNWENIHNAIKILIDQSKIYSRRIYELMESIYIKGFVNYEESKTLTLNDKGIADAKWLRDKSKEVLTSLQSEEIEAVKEKIIELYDQTDNFKRFITLKDDDNSIEIKDLMGFREKINELLSILPFDIYSRDL